MKYPENVWGRFWCNLHRVFMRRHCTVAAALRGYVPEKSAASDVLFSYVLEDFADVYSASFANAQ